MSRKKKDSDSSSSFLIGAIGLAIGAVGGFLLNKVLNSEE